MLHRTMGLMLLLGGLLSTPALAVEVVPAGAEVVEKLLWSSEPERPAWTMEVPAGSDSLLFEVGVSGPLADEAAARRDALHAGIRWIAMSMHQVLKERLAASERDALRAMAGNDYLLAQTFDLPLALAMVDKAEAQKWYRERWQRGEQVGEQVFVLVAVDTALIESHLQRALDQLAEEADWQLEQQQKKKAEEFWKQLQAENASKE